MPPLAQYHLNRLISRVPFRVTGLDFTGAFKVYNSHVDFVFILLFTCAVTRAVALEVTTLLTVIEFVQAVRRFAARFGMPDCVVSDNAFTFQAGQTLLTELMHHPVIDGFKSSHNLTWKFITPRAPRQGAFMKG
ncbi:uncharacterized protein [Palaemon carinicauda]|uniref:uncharacterized protein n=1 Tax=Palaemon carinicauda TaxID=392227 RepID=UPI0035B62560